MFPPHPFGPGNIFQRESRTVFQTVFVPRPGRKASDMLEGSLPPVGNNCGMGNVSKIQTLAQKCKSCAVLDELSGLDPVLLGNFLKYKQVPWETAFC